MARGTLTTAIALSSLLCALATNTVALTLDDRAGTIDGEVVVLAEIDRLLDGAISQQWSAIAAIQKAAAAAVCRDRALQSLLAREKVSASDWRARIWTASTPSPRDLAAARSQSRRPLDNRALAHALHVRRYRDETNARLEAEIAGRYEMVAAAETTLARGEPKLPAVAAQCLGSPITRQEIENFAAFPLYRRRAGIVATACRQFEIDYSNPLILARRAAAQGVSVEELLEKVEGGAAPSAAEVETAARNRYGNTDPPSLMKARIALSAVARTERRMAYLRQMIESTRGECHLDLPADPVVSPKRDRTPDTSIPVDLFATIECEHCAQTSKIAGELQRKHGDTIDFAYRHHFPDAALAPFLDALAIECARAVGGQHRYIAARLATPDAAPQRILRDLDLAAPTAACRADPRTAVRILDDTEEAQRLGFRDAIPSWVIGVTPRRGFQGLAILEATLAKEHLRNRGKGSR